MNSAHQHSFSKRFFLPISLLFVLVLSGCTLLPPVQEMSNARQSLEAAKTAGAEVHDSKRFLQAKMLLEQASEKIDSGEYTQARDLAVKAHTMAIKSRQISITNN